MDMENVKDPLLGTKNKQLRVYRKRYNQVWGQTRTWFYVGLLIIITDL